MTSPIPARDKINQILSATGVGQGQPYTCDGEAQVFQASLAGTDPCSAVVVIKGSLDNVGYETLATFTLLANGTYDSFTSRAAWPYFRADVLDATGIITSIIVNLAIGE